MSTPIERFESWYKEAQASDKVDADAVALATSTPNGHPSLRILYFRQLIGEKFCFFTNYQGRKGQNLSQNPRAAIVFLWNMIGKQVNVEGECFPLSPEESDAYFYKRAFESQLSAATSKQSQKLSSYQKFLDEIEENRKKFGNKITRPAHWGGYGLIPERIEFWEEQQHRRHKRECYKKEKGIWVKELLYP